MKRRRGTTQSLYKIMALAMILSMLGSLAMPVTTLAAPLAPVSDTPQAASQAGINALVLNENFDYGSTGGNLTAVSSGAWVNQSGTSGFVQYIPTSLTMASYAASGIGGASTILTTGVEDVRQSISEQNGVIYLSSLINVSSAGGGTYFFSLKNVDAGTYFRGKIFAKDTLGVLNFGFQADNETIQYSSTPFAYNTTYLVVVRYDVVTDTGALYVLESCPTSEPTPLLTGTGTNTTTPMAGILIRQASGGPSATIDGIRVSSATTWAEAAICAAAGPDLTIDKAVEPETDVANGGTVTYTVDLTNTTTAEITGVVFTDTLPTEVDFGGWINQPAGATVTADEINWTGSIPADTGLTFAFTATHTGDYGDVVTNTAEFAGASITGTAEAVFTVIDETSDITFVYHDLEDVVELGETLYIYGDFNAWNPAALLMTSDAANDVFTATVTGLTPGETYEYKYVLNGSEAGGNEDLVNTNNRSLLVAGSATVNDYRNVVVGWANLQWPSTLNATAFIDTDPVYGRLWINEVTNQGSPGRGIKAEVGYGDTATPADWTWFPMNFNVDDGNNDEFAGYIIPTDAGVYSYTTRFDGNWGAGNPNAGWTYGDLDGTYNTDPFELSQTGVMTVVLYDIGIEKDCPPSPVDPGDTILYTITYTVADQAVNGVVITDTLPTGVTYVDDSSGVTPDQTTPGTLVWSMGALAASGSFVVTATVDTDAPADLVNNVEIYATNDQIAANNTATCSNTCNISGALLVENFDYGSTGGNLTTASGGLWVNHSGTSNYIQYDPAINLVMPSYVSSDIGGSVSLVASGEDVNRTFSEQTTGVLYFAALVNLTSAPTAGDYFLHFKDETTMNFRARVFAKDVSGALQFGIHPSASSGAVYGATNFSYNTTYLVVAKYDIVNDTSALFVMEACQSIEPAPLVSLDASAAAENMLAMAIRQGTNTPAGIIDGIRVATTWAEAAACVPTLVINEYSASTTGADVEYIEVFGTPDTDFSNYTLLEIEGDGTSNMGTVDDVIPVGTTDVNGYWTISLPDGRLENGTITLLLVEDFTGSLSDDLDTNNDGVFDVTPWTKIVDDVASNDGGTGDLTYSASTLTVAYDGLPFAPGGASRIPNGVDTNTTADWMRNDFDLAGIPGFPGTPIFGEAYNTPGAVNAAVEPPPAVNISKVAPASVNIDTDFDYVLTVENLADLELTNVVITDSLPLSVTFVSASDGGVLLAGNVVSWTVTSLADGASINRTVTVTAPATPTTLTNDDYQVSADNWTTPSTGDPVVTTVSDPTAITPIADARAAGVGWTGTIQGNVTVPPNIYRGNAFVIQDATGGMYIYTGSKPLPPMALGDVMRVTGTIKDYNGLLEIDPVSAMNWVSTGTPPDPLPTATNSVGPTQGLLIVVEGTATWTGTPPTPGASDFSITINDGSGPVTVFIDKDTKIDMRSYTSPMQMRVIGFSGNYNYTGQVMPRYQTDIIDLTPPAVVSTDPADEATDVSLYYPLAATFNKAINADTLTTTTFLLEDSLGPVSGAVSYVPATKTAVFTPDAALSPLTVYTATLTTGVEDIYGGALAAPYIWSFTTGLADVTPPAITGRFPAPDATDVSLSANVVITFTEDLHPSSVSLSNFILEGSYGVVPSILSYDSVNFVVTLNPEARLLPTADYTVTVDGDTADWAGLTLGADDVWSFQTQVEPPMMVFFGDIHNHTSYSDGSGTPTQALSTGQAAGFDFMAITDHSYAIDDGEWADTLAAVDAATIDGTFVALRGFEYTQGAEGHINVYNTVRHACRTNTGFAYCDYTPNLEAGVTVQGFYPWVAITGTVGVDDSGTLMHFNHPGWMNFNDWAYHPELSDVARLTEVGNGSGTSYVFSEDEYQRALDYGWRLGATNNADTHSLYWGTNTDHRTGVLMPELTKDALMEGLRERRTFATEDKNYALSMKANGAWMGAEIANTGYIQFEIDGSDTDGEITTLVEIVTDGGAVVASYAPGTATFLWSPYITITTGVHYFYVRAIQADGDRVVTSPVWTLGGEDIAITDVIIQPTIPTIHNPSLLTARVTNRVTESRTVTVTMDVDGVPLLPEVVVTVAGNSDAYANFSWQPVVTGTVTVTAQFFGAPVEDNPDDNVGVLTLDVTDEQLPLILIDAGHGNLNAAGREMRMFIDDLSAHQYNVLKNLDALTAEELDPDVVKLLIITAPQYAYTAAELEAIGNYVAGGGSLWLLGIADYTGKLPWADTVAPRLNAILDAVETETGQTVNMRMNDDEVIDANTNNGYVFGVIFSDFPSEDTTSIGLNVDALATWSLNSIVDGNFQALTADDTGVQILVQGDLDEGYGPPTWYNPNHTSNTDADGAGDAYIYNPTWFYPNPMPPDAVPLPIAAAVALDSGAGRIILYGDSNDPFTTFAYTAGDGKQNELFNLEAVMWLLGEPLEKSTIAEARYQEAVNEPVNLDTLVWVEGTITAAYGEFFNVLYVQDDTGGITVHAPAGDIYAADYMRGAEVRVVGTVGIYNGDTEIEFFEAEMVQVIDPGTGEPLPLPMSTYQASLEENQGWLAVITGTVTAKMGVDTLYVDDGSGVVRIFVDGYNGEFSDIEVNDLVRVTGLVSEDGEGGRIRIRNYQVHTEYDDDVVVLEQTLALEIGKSVSTPAMLMPGSTVTYTLALSNTGTGLVVDIVLTDTLPAGVTFNQFIQANGATELNGTISWMGNLPVDDTLLVVFTADVNQDNSLYGQIITNTVEYTSPAAGSGSAEAAFSLPGAPNVLIDKSVELPELLNLGEIVTYTLVLNNIGEVPAINLEMIDALPAGLSFHGWVQQNGAAATGNLVSWNGSLSGELVIIFTAQIDPANSLYGATLVNTANYTSDNAGTGSASAEFELGMPYLTIEKTVDAASFPVMPGDTITYTIVVSNVGLLDAVAVNVTDFLPAHVIGTNLNTVVDLPAGSSQTFTVVATLAEDAPYGSQIVNTASFNCWTVNGSDTASFTVINITTVFLPVLLRQ